MPGLVPGIPVFFLTFQEPDVDGRDRGERSDAVLRTAMPSMTEHRVIMRGALRHRIFRYQVVLNPALMLRS